MMLSCNELVDLFLVNLVFTWFTFRALTRIKFDTGQLHLDLAKYHEMQRFTEAEKEGYDKEAALYHLKHAADCGNLEGIITMSRIALHLPHDVLTDLEMEESVENTDLGLDYMHNVT